MKKIISFLIVLIGLSLTACSSSGEKDLTITDNKSEDSDKSITTYILEDNKVIFGKYPQTLITDDFLINKLINLSGILPASAKTYNWIAYNYYINGYIKRYMFYQDIDIDNDGLFDYRGVYFTQYRPYLCGETSSESNSIQDDNGYYIIDEIYWFRYDPIEWDILFETNGKALIIADLILDSQEYYSTSSLLQFEHNGGTGYSDNYALSNIRKFLNEDFYNTAFNELQKVLIETTEVDNSVSSTDDYNTRYSCENTYDKMFLISYDEVNTYYVSNEGRSAKGTDYAKSQGLLVYNETSYWWLRSPYANLNSAPLNVVHDGDFCYYNVYNTSIGVRPTCWINL